MLNRLIPSKPAMPRRSATIPDGLLPQDEDGTRTAAAKAVNDLLNYYVAVADSKASIFLAGSVTAAAFLLFRSPPGVTGKVIYFSGAAFLGACMIVSALAIIPRLPRIESRKAGGVFWGDIASHESAADYGKTFSERSARKQIDHDYIILNFKTSHILREKMALLRLAIICFVIGVAFAIIHHVASGPAA